MATIVKSTLKASGGDYSSIKDWIDYLLANTPDFVANDIIPTLECYKDWPLGLDESFVDFKSGFTTDADHYFNIVTPTSERHTGVAGTGFWFNSSTVNYTFYSRNQYVVFDGLEVSAPNGANSMFDASANTIVKNCILHNIVSVGFSSTSGARFENCIAYLTAPSSSGNVGKAFQNAKLDYITAYISPDSGAFNGDIIFQNCICNNVYMFHNHTKTSYDSFFGGSGDYNVALAINGNLPGANSFYIADDSDLVDPDNFDFRIKSTSPLATAGSGDGRIGAYYETGDTPTVEPVVPYDQACETVNQSATLGKLSPVKADNQTTKSVSEKATTGKLSEVKASNQITISVNAKAILQRLSGLSTSNQITGTVNQSQKLTRTANLTISNQITSTVSEYAYIERLAALNAYNQSCVTVSSKGTFVDSTNLYTYNQALKTVNQSAILGKSAKLTASNQTTKVVNQSALLTRLAKLNASNQITRAVNQQAPLKRTAFVSSYSQICKSINQSSALGRFAPVSALNQTTITVNQYAYLYSGTFPTFGDDDVVTVVVGGKFTCSVQSEAVSAIVKTKVYNSTVTTKLITASSMPSIKG